jgi:hypothetical protein
VDIRNPFDRNPFDPILGQMAPYLYEIKGGADAFLAFECEEPIQRCEPE